MFVFSLRRNGMIRPATFRSCDGISRV
ncbi:UNVERIFIED_CONTAM: hypothetical protein GTU68_022915 [Idotea baltica]|nr:hypothetical protein [Idotea baltica]